MATGSTNTSGQFKADVGYKKRPKHPKLPLAGEPKRRQKKPKVKSR